MAVDRLFRIHHLAPATLLVALALAAPCFAAGGEAALAERPGRPDYCGVWGIWGGEKVSTEGRPWFKGVVVTTNWESVEPERGRFDWSKFDQDVMSVTDKGLNVMLLVYHGCKCPEWIYSEAGVPKVLTDEPNESQRIHPYYLDPAFRPLLVNLIQKTAEHVQAYPPEVRDKIIGVQCPTGKSGDPQAYNGTPLDKRFAINLHGPEWVEWSLSMFPVYIEAWRPFPDPFFLLFKGPNPETNDWLMTNAPRSWRKPHAVAQGNTMNNEMDYSMELYPWTHGVKDGVLIRTRGELDNTGGGAKNWFNAAPVWNVYWTGLWTLTWGLDIWNQLTGVLEDERHAPALAFFSQYAGYKHPADAPGAWIALRDALDVKDLERFPESEYGEYGGKSPYEICSNLERYQKIAEAFAPFGAVLEDLERFDANGLKARGMKGLNDVNCNVWPGNYQMFMSQIDPQETSQGYWRVGTKNERFGRFARGFLHAAGKDAMRFQLAEGFFADEPADGPRRVTLRVVYFDGGKGEWALRYDAMGDANKTALTIRKTDSGQWKEAAVEIEDGRFARGGDGAADIALVNTDAEDDVFHMIELVRGAN